ncbi:MAG: helix-turn-helix transcriptional regulator [Chloroflexi bacterium]|nr:helix-turn-helix transcriptional regulator [Chloroflexota bacterium]
MTNLARERAARRAAGHARASAGADVLRQREDAGLTVAELARASGVDASFIRRIEAGAQSASLDTYARLAMVLGADMSLRLYPTTGATIRDRHQSAIAEALLGIVHPRWARFTEIAVTRPSRGWIDLGFHDAKAAVFLAIEIESGLRRLEQQIRWAEAKAAALPSWEGWARLEPEPAISQLVVVRETRTTRGVADEHRRLLRTAYPADPRDALDALRGSDPWPGRAILWAAGGGSSEAPYRLVARP